MVYGGFCIVKGELNAGHYIEKKYAPGNLYKKYQTYLNKD